ncbi:MAG: GIY-YIG nuclease family protein [Bacteroidota bacterium]
MKEEYRQMKFRMGIFQIRNKINNKVFIGSSNDLIAKWNSQKFQLEAGMHANAELQKDWNEKGEENFEYSILDEIDQGDDTEKNNKDLKVLEQLWFEKISPFDEKGYNRPIKK